MKFTKLNMARHCLSQVSKLIFESVSGTGDLSEKITLEMLEKLIRKKNTQLSSDHIYVSLEDEEITGLIIGYSGEERERFGEQEAYLSAANFLEYLCFLIFVKPALDRITRAHIDLGRNDFYISVLAVGKQHRGRGIGSLLVKHTIKLARNSGFGRVVLDVSAENERAKRLYEKLGFKINEKVIYNESSKPTCGYVMEYIL